MTAKTAVERQGAATLTFAKWKNNTYKIVLLMALAALSVILYLTINVHFDDPALFKYAMSLRIPKVIVMLTVAFCVGGASIVFQSVINNTIVTPCLLGINSIYLLIHTAVAFLFGAGSLVARNSNVAFLVDSFLMGIIATFIYSYMFKKTRYNILYILLIGTVLTSFFTSLQTTMIRVMDPNEYDTLLATLVANFNNVNAEITLLSVVMIALVLWGLRKDLNLLDVITLGKDQAINLGVDYDHTVKRLLLGVVLFITIATAMVGPISFLGIIIANLARQFLKTYKHSQLILGSVLLGVVLLIGGQLIVEQVFSYSIPISVFITVGGGLYFLYLLFTHKRKC